MLSQKEQQTPAYAEHAIHCQPEETGMRDTCNLDLNQMQGDYETEKKDGEAILNQLATSQTTVNRSEVSL